jgi:hypothetical protein
MAVVLAMVAALAITAPAGAVVVGHGLAGYVTDADTGLGLDGATATWNGTTTPAPQATTDYGGRYLFTGLDGSSVGSLTVVGPAGWARTTTGAITLPASGYGNQGVALHRDWASAPGGATATATGTDPAAAAAGCGPANATDGDPANGWSSTAPHAAIPATDTTAAVAAVEAPTLTVQLPQTIDVRGVILDAAAVCRHAAGAALGRYRVETSADGASWATAAEGVLGAADRGVATAAPLTGNTTGVRAVRLTLLNAQDPAAATIDLRTLQVFGVGPNQPPTGTVTTDVPRTVIKSVIRLRAAFTDPDSTILRYLWDFDGDGHFDQATTGPSVPHVWAGPGIYHVTVGARDFRGGLGTASIDLRVVDPNALVEAIPQRKPLITFDPPTGIDLPVRIACSSKCSFTATMVLTQRMAKRIHAPRRTILRFARKTEGPGLGSWTLSVPSKTIKLLQRAHLKKVTVRLTASAVDREHRRSTVHRWVAFR